MRCGLASIFGWPRLVLWDGRVCFECGRPISGNWLPGRVFFAIQRDGDDLRRASAALCPVKHSNSKDFVLHISLFISSSVTRALAALNCVSPERFSLDPDLDLHIFGDSNRRTDPRQPATIDESV